MMKLWNSVLVVVACVISVFLGVESFIDGNSYRMLIRFSVLLTMLVPYLLNFFLKKKIPESMLCLFLTFVFCGHFLGSVLDFYGKIYWYDKLTHFVSGILTALLSFFLLLSFRQYGKNKAYDVFFLIATTALVAVSWECIEYTTDILFQKDAQNVLTTGVNDTMQDMIVALLGSILVSVCYLYEHSLKKDGIVLKFVNTLKPFFTHKV